METTCKMEWLCNAIRLSLTSVLRTLSDDDEFGPPELKDPRFQKIINGIQYSKKLLLTYNIIICGLFLLVAAGHWSERVFRRRRRMILGLERLRDDALYDVDALYKGIQKGSEPPQTLEVSSSSGSSTPEGAESLLKPIKNLNEETPLRHDEHASRILHQRSSVFPYLKAFWMHQPRSIPLINKTLPSNGHIIVITGLILLNIFYTIFNINFSVFELFVFADRAGLVFVANLPLLYLLAAKMEPIKLFTGYSYESLNIFHRRLGELICLEAFLHALGMIGVWYTILRPRESLAEFLLHKMIWYGLGAFVAYELLYFTSLASFRQRWYELFLALHVFLQAAALVLVFLHHSGARIYVGIALSIFLIDRLVHRVWVRCSTVASFVEVMEDRETVRLSTTLNLQCRSSLSRVLGRKITNGWEASDHVFLTVPILGRSHTFQAHPFTIISPAPITGQKEARLDLLIRAQNGFSSDLLQQAMRCNSLTIRLDGPYGSHHARTLLQDSDLAFIVAGGSGIAVGWPLVNFLLDESSSTPLENEAISISMPPRQEIVLIWVVHRAAHMSWIGSSALRRLESKGVQVIIPDATEEVGRPNLVALMTDIVTRSGSGKKIGVVGSGPDSMNRSVRNTCASMARDGWDVDVIIEKFGW